MACHLHIYYRAYDKREQRSREKRDSWRGGEREERYGRPGRRGEEPYSSGSSSLHRPDARPSPGSALSAAYDQYYRDAAYAAYIRRAYAYPALDRYRPYDDPYMRRRMAGATVSSAPSAATSAAASAPVATPSKDPYERPPPEYYISKRASMR